MKKKMYYLMVAFLSSVLLVSLSSQQVFASETGNDNKEIRVLYQKAISEKKVDPNKYTFEAFQENYDMGKTDYYAMKDTIGSGLGYNKWFGEMSNYGAFPDGEGHSPSEAKKSSMLRGSQTTNGNKLKKAIKKGDILIVSNGGFGHAAIATSDNYILEMSGGGSNSSKWVVGGIPDNNHQFSKEKWIFGGYSQGIRSSKRIDTWIQLWRVPNKSVANKVASYADKTFWNSSHAYKKNKHIKYKVSTATMNKNPNYCSKMVFQSYYYGSGSINAIEPAMAGLDWISPSMIPRTFTAKYYPKKIGTY